MGERYLTIALFSLGGSGIHIPPCWTLSDWIQDTVTHLQQQEAIRGSIMGSA